jgi:toxin-antitoxin system PIN domain toxin
MTIVDVNVLLYAVNSSDPQHDAASRWLVRALNGAEIVGIPWLTILAFVRLATSSRVFPAALSVGDAFGLMQGWLARRSVVIPTPTARHLAVLHGLVAGAGTAGTLVADAHLAALALEHGAQVASFDRDFLRFAGVQLVTPRG